MRTQKDVDLIRLKLRTKLGAPLVEFLPHKERNVHSLFTLEKTLQHIEQHQLPVTGRLNTIISKITGALPRWKCHIMGLFCDGELIGVSCGAIDPLRRFYYDTYNIKFEKSVTHAGMKDLYLAKYRAAAKMGIRRFRGRTLLGNVGKLSQSDEDPRKEFAAKAPLILRRAFRGTEFEITHYSPNSGKFQAFARKA